MDEMYYYWLHNVPGIGKGTFQKILKHMSPRELFESDQESRFFFLTDKQRENIAMSKKQWNIVKEWKDIESRKIKIFLHESVEYPQKLSQIPDPPPILYYKGKQDIMDKPSVAVIGARACSNYGSLAAKELGRELATMGIVVVSGMARGIDSICQSACLEHGGESIGVLGSGVEVCYPPENRALYERLQEQGCLVSENPPYTQPCAGLFPLRNRIISGLADVIVVIESREKSGTQITVDMALEQGKEVYALPGRITDTVSRGCNKLIKQGAGILLSPREFVEEICPMLKLKYQGKEVKVQPSLSNEEKRILSIMGVSMMSMEEIYEELKQVEETVSLTQIMGNVLELRMKGIIEEESGHYYCNNLRLSKRENEKCNLQ